jgi:hypothetical protein
MIGQFSAVVFLLHERCLRDSRRLGKRTTALRNRVARRLGLEFGAGSTNPVEIKWLHFQKFVG